MQASFSKDQAIFDGEINTIHLDLQWSFYEFLAKGGTTMEIRRYTHYSEAEIVQLYGSVGWTSYTNDPSMLKAAFASSLLILGAFEKGDLIGIIRAVGDGASIIYIQDILVHPEHQRQGIGSKLLASMLEHYSNVYQICLMTDDTEKTISFYRSCGFTKASDIGCCGFMRINRR